jgi:hypothetical protein
MEARGTPSSPAEAVDADLPQTFEHKETLTVTIPPQQQVSEVRLPLILPAPHLFGSNVKILPIRVAIEHLYSSCYHSVAVDFSFGCPDYQTIALCANPLTQGLYHQSNCAFIIPGSYGGFNRYFGTENPLIVHDRSSRLRKLSEEVDTVYFGVQPTDVFAKAPRTLINGARHVLILTDEFNYASDAILQYLGDNRHLPLFRDACQLVNGEVYAVRESDWDEIFAPFIEKLKDVEFIENNQFVSFRRVDGHPFGAMPKYWEGDYVEANLTDSHMIDMTLVIHYLILKPNADPNALRVKSFVGPSALMPTAAYQTTTPMMMMSSTGGSGTYLPTGATQQGYVMPGGSTGGGTYGIPPAGYAPSYGAMTASSLPSELREMAPSNLGQPYPASYNVGHPRVSTTTGYPNF